MRNKVDTVNQSAASPEQVVESIHAIMHRFRALQLRSLRDGPHDLTQMEGKALSFFGRRAGATLSDLVAHTERDKGQLARLIAGLRERGLLEARADEGDRRNQRLYLTREGNVVLQSLRRGTQRLSAEALAGLSASERQQLLKLLEQVRANLESDS